MMSSYTASAAAQQSYKDHYGISKLRISLSIKVKPAAGVDTHTQQPLVFGHSRSVRQTSVGGSNFEQVELSGVLLRL